MNYNGRARCFGGGNGKGHGAEFMSSDLHRLWRHRFSRAWGLSSRSRDFKQRPQRLLTFRHESTSLMAQLSRQHLWEMISFPRPFLLYLVPSPMATCLPHPYWWKCQVCSLETLYVQPMHVKQVLARIKWCLGSRTGSSVTLDSSFSEN